MGTLLVMALALAQLPARGAPTAELDGAPAAEAVAERPGATVEAALATDAAPAAPAAPADPDAEACPDGADDDEVVEADPSCEPGLLYSCDLPDAVLVQRYKEAPETLGSASIGLVAAGRLINGVQMADGDAWKVVAPANAWGTQETVDGVEMAARRVREQFPDAPPLRVNHIGRQEGGHLRPHQSHQSGRDVDLGFYYPSGVDPRHLKVRREEAMDLAANWTLVRALVTGSDVEFILVDKRVQKVLRDWAVSHGEDRAWVDSLFGGAAPLIRHARHHRDHFHVRFFAPRSQELGRRLQPLLADQPEQNFMVHRVRAGDTLGHIAARYGTTVRLIQRANGLGSAFIRAGQSLTVPLDGPCTKCPKTPALVVPPRRLPPDPTRA